MKFVFVAAMLLGFASQLFADASDASVTFDTGWKFTLGDSAGAEAPTFNDAEWRGVDLPHDWSIAGPVARNNPMGSPGGFFVSGIGWYRKTFIAPDAWAGKQVAIQFDGVYMSSTVWINGQKLGVKVSGFSPFTYDLTPHLKLGQPNAIAVRVDNARQPNARWYAGSGIYRHVRIDVRESIHVSRFGVSLRTDAVTEGTAKLSVATTIENAGGAPDAEFECATQVFSADVNGRRTGEPLATFETTRGRFSDKAKTLTVNSATSLPAAKLWSAETPHLYVALTTINVAGKVVDTRETTFGVRTISVSAAKGFLLNDKPVEMYGACVHDDNGPLGVAAFDRAEIRRVELLKSAGFNAVRCAHNPPAPAFLDACDRLGLLVIDEAFDTWSLPKTPGDFGRHFNTLWQDELDTMILRDRNHPSIVVWSLGNEILLWGNQTAKSAAEGSKLIARTKELDPTRFTTTAAAGWNLPDKSWDQMNPLLNKFDVVGYNYAINRYESDHARFPERVIIGTESFPRDLFLTFDYGDRFAHVIGDFVWTGIDYLGESGIGRYHEPGDTIFFHTDPRHFPYHGAYCGDIDITGFRKPISYARNITWGRGEMLYTSVTDMTPDGRRYKVGAWGIVPSRASWTLPGFEGKPVEVQVYSRCDSVQLYLNDKLIGEKPTTRAEEFRATFDVPYAPGTLKTVGIVGGKEAVTTQLHTANAPAGLRLTVDRQTIDADGQDLSFIIVEAIDDHGELHPNADHQVTFSLDGPGTIAGVANADFGNVDSYQGDHRKLFQGRAMLVIRSTDHPGIVTIRASADGMNSAKAQLNTVRSNPSSFER